MSEASLPGDVIRSVIEGEEKRSRSREAGICGRSTSPGPLSSAFERTALPSVLRCSLPSAVTRGLLSLLAGELARRLVRGELRSS